MKEVKRFSIRNKLVIIFGLLITLALLTLGLLAVRIAQKAVTEKVETHLIDKARDTAEIVDGRINAFFQFIEGIARMPAFRSNTVSFDEKQEILQKEAAFNSSLHEAAIATIDGLLLTSSGKKIPVNNFTWFQTAAKGKRAITEPFISVTDGKLIVTFAVPIYNEDKTVAGVLGVSVLAKWLSQMVNDIVVGQTGYCGIIDKKGGTVAHKDFSLVSGQNNMIENAKKNAALQSLAGFLKHSLQAEHNIGFFDYNKTGMIAASSKMKTTGWTVVINAPIHEFMNTIEALRITMLGIGIGILITVLIIVFVAAGAMVKSVSTVVEALRNIAQGEGDLTARLPLKGNDEVTDLADYFNQTIAKIGILIQSVSKDTVTMETMGIELASNMSETASAIHQISANIDSTKRQTINQAASVTETAATIEQIIRTIRQLNNNIESQAASVEESSASIEQMVTNIASITQILGKTNMVIKELAAATEEGKSSVSGANSVTQKIVEEAGGLLEASSVIQHIASQTNLLAMNAAIEAAHAGDAGKGFAVVADEIRKLAEESSAQGKNITATLKNLSAEIETLSTSAKKAEEKFYVIFNLSGEVDNMGTRLMYAVKEQESGSKEVLDAIKDINEVTAQVNDGSAEMLKGSENVAVEMRKLDELTRVITESMNEMASGAIQISNAVQEVNEITQKNKASIESLAEEVRKFKT